MRFSFAMLSAAVLAAAGCGGSYDDPLSGSRRQADPGALGVVVEPAEPAAAKTEESEGPAAEEVQPASEEEPAAPVEEPSLEEAKVGVGEKGSGYGGGIVTTPVSVYWRTQERITYNIEVPHAMNLYKATTGHGPRTHEEFMEKIIEANRIDLPELPAGHKYVYDPQKERLMVEHPPKR